MRAFQPRALIRALHDASRARRAAQVSARANGARRRASTGALVLSILGASTACAAHAPLESTHAAGDGAALIAFDPRVGASIAPEIDATTGVPEYSLEYGVSADGTAMTTRYRGASEAFSVGLGIALRQADEWHELAARVGRTDQLFVLARWTCDSNGKVARALVRTEPLLEVRPVWPGDIVGDVEWRPLVNGRAGGEWRSAR